MSIDTSRFDHLAVLSNAPVFEQQIDRDRGAAELRMGGSGGLRLRETADVRDGTGKLQDARAVDVVKVGQWLRPGRVGDVAHVGHATGNTIPARPDALKLRDLRRAVESARRLRPRMVQEMAQEQYLQTLPFCDRNHSVIKHDLRSAQAAKLEPDAPMPKLTFAPPGPAFDMETGSVFRPKFDSQGLLAAIVTDAASGEVLMFAWINAEALEATIETKIAHFWSRSRQKLWKKGEESGNLLEVREMRVDCDQDAVWLKVDVRGGGVACHTGAKSCFYRKVEQVGSDVALRSVLE